MKPIRHVKAGDDRADWGNMVVYDHRDQRFLELVVEVHSGRLNSWATVLVKSEGGFIGTCPCCRRPREQTIYREPGDLEIVHRDTTRYATLMGQWSHHLGVKIATAEARIR